MGAIHWPGAGTTDSPGPKGMADVAADHEEAKGRSFQEAQQQSQWTNPITTTAVESRVGRWEATSTPRCTSYVPQGLAIARQRGRCLA